MIRVVILGFGNVGQHLHKIFHETKGVNVIQGYTRNTTETTTKAGTPLISKISEIDSSADVYIVAIPDDAIKGFTKELKLKDKLVVHTSGGVAMNTISKKHHRGIFYPLQTFSKNTEVDFKIIPICIEAEKENDLKLLRKLGELISNKVVDINSSERAQIHLAAVFVNNFVNELYHISEDILKEKSLDFELLKPLISETAKKIETLSPSKAQTGPANRGDIVTIEKHLSMIEAELQEKVYMTLTRSILKRK
ncbi:hypothetical protein ULMS_15530 [Patiriisocius marinistellae]|uniref:DUF2520 domain-containing protein n=1 Tax=Patiriisocius marinistellae TaxID=2494560 RepID=A0A5J4G115_9FLAO|nr:DUF2520 domain-containing protein [Patiriisocius marinistellae]GEQ86045.1 hypothetical protein ULMS_15530 [Patiriisocius marinistellae]